MNDLEDLLRDELGDRARAAEAAVRRGALLAGLERRIRQARLRRRIAASALASAAVLGAIALPAALLAHGHYLPAIGNPAIGSGHRAVPLSDPSLTPPGWSAVTFRDAQVSVPSSWVVQGSLGSVCGVTTPGAVIMGRAMSQPAHRPARCRLPATTVFLSEIPFRPRPVMRQHLNGIPVAPLPDGPDVVSYAVPTLGVEVTASGPMASQVVATLTWSPLSVVRARGPEFPVPPAWRWHRFGGIRFAAPASWRLERDDTWGDCGSPIIARTTRLTTATHAVVHGCIPFSSTAGSVAAIPGVVVATGRYSALASGPLTYPLTARCATSHGMRTCANWSTSALLALTIFAPGRPKPILVEIGLAGTGATARTIFDSIRPAARP